MLDCEKQSFVNGKNVWVCLLKFDYLVVFVLTIIQRMNCSLFTVLVTVQMDPYPFPPLVAPHTT